MAAQARITNCAYPRRPGSDDSGRDYEIKITTLLALRCATMEDTKDMWLGSNLDQVGDFDDIVLCKQTSKGKIVYMIQLKHQENPKNVTPHDFKYSTKNQCGKKKKSKEDFSLAKYCKGFIELKERFSNPTNDEVEIIRHLRRTDKITYILYTNKGVANECDFLENLDDSTLNFINTGNTTEHNVFKFNSSKLDYDFNFLQQLILFSNQIHVGGVDKLIEQEIKKLVGSTKLVKVDFKKITDDFVTFIKLWAKGSGSDVKKENLKIFYTLTKQDVINKLIDLLLDPFKLDFLKDKYSFYDCPLKNTWNQIIYSKAITLIDSDDTILQFLKQYIGTEVKNYCNDCGKMWADHLSKNNESLFYKEQRNLNTKLLKISSSCEQITKFSIYKCLWYNNLVPLLLQVDNIEEQRVIIKVLKIASYKLPVIIIIHNPTEVKNKDSSKCFMTLEDLNKEHRDKILKQTVKLQGRSSIELGNLIDESMYHHIKCRDIIHILLNDYSIGNEYESLPKYFIQQKLLKVFLKLEVFKEINDEVFIIENKADSRINTEFENEDYPNVIVVQEVNLEQVEELKSTKEIIHRLIYHRDNCLEWKESFGSVTNIKKYKIKSSDNYDNTSDDGGDDQVLLELKDFIKNFFKNSLLNRTHVVSSAPGMGKSVLTDFIALEAPNNLWILKIILNEHEEYYENFQCKSNCLDYFNDVILKKYDCFNVQLSKAVFQKFLSENNILVILDGFDEISITYQEEVTDIAKYLYEKGYHLWITTRPVMKSHLEENFSAISTSLMPFTVNEQKIFLTNYFALELSLKGNYEFIVEFVEKLLRAARDNLNDRFYEFTGVPLQSKLLANVFIDNLKASLKTGTVNLNDNFDLIFLYEEFVKRKTDILCEKFGKDAKRTRMVFTKHQQLFALKILFDKNELLKLDVDKQLREYYKAEENKNLFLQREGIVLVEQNDEGTAQIFNVTFTHRTFAEYLAAQWLAQNVRSTDENIKETVKILVKLRFDSKKQTRHKFLMIMFDCLLAKHCPLHLTVINNQTEIAKALIESDPDVVNMIDNGGRTILHIMAFSRFYKPEFTTCEIWEDEMADVVELLPDNNITDIKDNILSYSALDCAFASKSLAVANKMCEKSDNLKINLCVSDVGYCSMGNMYDQYYFYHDIDTVNVETLIMHAESLFKVLLPYFACRDLLMNLVNAQESITSYCAHITEGTFTDANYLKQLNVTTVSELFQFKSINIYSPINYNYYYDLRFAATFGIGDNLLHLISFQNADVNKQDVYDNTPLHYAVIHGRLENVKILLFKGAEVNVAGHKGNTPAHHAAKNGFNDIITILQLSKGIDFNKQNNDGETPLLFALWHDHVETAALLISYGANGLLEDNEGNVALHFAAAKGSNDIMLHLLGKGADINKQSSYGDNALLYALKGSHINTAKLLLSHGINGLAENNEGAIALHFAALEGCYDIVLDLLSKGADINKQDQEGDTPLLLALLNNHVDVAKLLFSNDADVSIENKQGTTALHLAAEKGFCDIVQILLSKTDDINKRDGKGNTALLSALWQKEHIDTAKLLLSHGADNLKDNYEGFCPLHLAALNGNDEIVLDVLNMGASINKQTSIGYTPLHFALFRNHEDTVKLLLSHGADCTSQNWHVSPLHLIVQKGFFEILTDIFALPHFKNLDINMQDKQQKTLLHYSISQTIFENDDDVFHPIKTLNLLLDKGANVNAQDIDGNTTLHSAIISSKETNNNSSSKVFYEKVVELLLNNGADVNLENKEGKTVFDLANDNDNTEIICLIQDHSQHTS